jgi:hypothetical protein
MGKTLLQEEIEENAEKNGSRDSLKTISTIKPPMREG